VAWIVKKEKDGKIYYYRNLKHTSHFTDNKKEAEKFNSYNMAIWHAKTINGTVEELNIFGKEKRQ
jgi:hypothetical protein